MIKLETVRKKSVFFFPLNNILHLNLTLLRSKTYQITQCITFNGIYIFFKIIWLWVSSRGLRNIFFPKKKKKCQLFNIVGFTVLIASPLDAASIIDFLYPLFLICS